MTHSTSNPPDNEPGADYRQRFALNFKDKNVNYDEKMATLLLRAFGRGSEVSRYRKDKLLTLNRVCDDLFSGNVGLGVKKVSNAINLQALIARKLHTTEIGKEFAEVKSNWSFATTVGLIFDHHGDGISDFVLHTDVRMLDESSWHMVTFHKDGTRYYIQPLSGFMSQLKYRFAV